MTYPTIKERCIEEEPHDEFTTAFELQKQKSVP